MAGFVGLWCETVRAGLKGESSGAVVVAVVVVVPTRAGLTGESGSMEESGESGERDVRAVWEEGNRVEEGKGDEAGVWGEDVSGWVSERI